MYLPGGWKAIKLEPVTKPCGMFPRAFERWAFVKKARLLLTKWVDLRRGSLISMPLSTIRMTRSIFSVFSAMRIEPWSQDRKSLLPICTIDYRLSSINTKIWKHIHCRSDHMIIIGNHVISHIYPTIKKELGLPRTFLGRTARFRAAMVSFHSLRLCLRQFLVCWRRSPFPRQRGWDATSVSFLFFGLFGCALTAYTMLDIGALNDVLRRIPCSSFLSSCLFFLLRTTFELSRIHDPGYWPRTSWSLPHVVSVGLLCMSVSETWSDFSQTGRSSLLLWEWSVIWRSWDRYGCWQLTFNDRWYVFQIFLYYGSRLTFVCFVSFFFLLVMESSSSVSENIPSSEAGRNDIEEISGFHHRMF